MANSYSNPTADLALGNVRLEFTDRVIYARSLERRRKAGRLTRRDIEEARPLFRGIFRGALPKKLLEEFRKPSPAGFGRGRHGQ